MKSFVHNLLKTAVFMVVLFAGTSQGAFAQEKVNCDAPKTNKWQGEAKVHVEAGKQECERAKKLAKLANDLRGEAKDQNDYAKNQRARAKEAEDSAKDRREEVKELAKELTKRPKTADTNLEQQTRRLRTISETGGEFSNSVVFSLGVTEAIAVPMFYDLNWAEAERSSKDAVEAYRTALGFTWESDINFLTIVLSVAELSVENFEAEVTERQDRAALHDTTSAAAKQAATSVGDAAHVHEHAAILHYVKGALRYLDAKGVDTKAKKEIEQTIKFVESHMSRLPKPVAERATSLIATSREALK